MSFRRFSAALALVLLTSLPAAAHGYKVGSLTVGHPWTRATPAGAQVAGGFLSVENKGSEPDRLVSATFDGAATAEIHEMANKDGVMTMRKMDGGVAIPAGAKITLQPGGLHLMFHGLKAPLKQGASVPGTLQFEKAGSVKVEFKVEAIGARGEGSGQGTDHSAH